MSSKKKLNQYKPYNNIPSVMKEVEEAAPVAVIEEYKPSENEEKYPKIETDKKQYRISAFRNDYVKLQDEVNKLLDEGWQLQGGVSTAMIATPYESVTIFAQALIK